MIVSGETDRDLNSDSQSMCDSDSKSMNGMTRTDRDLNSDSQSLNDSDSKSMNGMTRTDRDLNSDSQSMSNSDSKSVNGMTSVICVCLNNFVSLTLYTKVTFDK